MSILHQEVQKYARIWTFPEYRRASHSLSLWHQQRDAFPAQFKSALDIGCGLGRLFALWNEQGIDAWAVDLVENSLEPEIRVKYEGKFVQACLWEMTWPRTFDVGVCTDVMEHIPPQYVEATLARIASCCRVTVFKIAHGPSNDLGGLPLHLTLQPRSWWAAELGKYGTVEQLADVTRSGQLDSVWRLRSQTC